MQVGRLLQLAVMLAAFGLANTAASAGEWQQSVHVAKIPGFKLVAMGAGEKPCDFVREKLLNDARFVLNTANMDFAELDNLSAEQSSWPLLSVFAQSLKTNNGCVWTLVVSVRATITGGSILGEPYGGVLPIWESTAFGTAAGDGLTAYVSEAAQDYLKELVNDMHASRKKFTQ
jgi:hypothetical protein